MPYPGGLLSRPEYAKWNALRDKDASRWLTLSFNRFLLRTPYSSRQRNTLGLTETIHHHNDYLWGDAVWLLTSLITASFARNGWPTEITGMDNGQVADLPLHSVNGPANRKCRFHWKLCCQGSLPRIWLGAESHHSSANPTVTVPTCCGHPCCIGRKCMTTKRLLPPVAPWPTSPISSWPAGFRKPYRATSRDCDPTHCQQMTLVLPSERLVRQLVTTTGAGADVPSKYRNETDQSGKRQVDLRSSHRGTGTQWR